MKLQHQFTSITHHIWQQARNVQFAYCCPVATPNSDTDRKPLNGLSDIIAIISNKQPMSWHFGNCLVELSTANVQEGNSLEEMFRMICSSEFFMAGMSGAELSGVGVQIPMLDYRTLHVIVVIWTTHRHTNTHTETRQTESFWAVIP